MCIVMSRDYLSDSKIADRVKILAADAKMTPGKFLDLLEDVGLAKKVFSETSRPHTSGARRPYRSRKDFPDPGKHSGAPINRHDTKLTAALPSALVLAFDSAVKERSDGLSRPQCFERQFDLWVASTNFKIPDGESLLEGVTQLFQLRVGRDFKALFDSACTKRGVLKKVAMAEILYGVILAERT